VRKSTNDLIAVIQCASGKRDGAGHLTTVNGKPVTFVAQRELAPHRADREYAEPDDPSGYGSSWREFLQKHNNDHSGDNPARLCPAYQLYKNKAYVRLADGLGVSNVYVLSAGWGLIRADFLTPFYDITFSSSADTYKRRRKKDRFDDLRMLPESTKKDIVFFGSRECLPLFCSLTDSVRAKRIVFYNSQAPPQCNGCTLKKFVGTRHTNWQYDCVNAFLDGRVSI
jgi:hypothetical protein